MNLALCVATMQPKNAALDDVCTWFDHASTAACLDDHQHWVHNTAENNLGVVGSYQRLYVESTEDILVYAHDDVIMREEGWDERILKEFQQPAVGLVGFGGARWHGVPELYKTPYQLQQLRRGDYLSNVDDAEVHGQRFTGVREVAVLDGFVLAVRRELLDRIRGWQVLLAAGIDFLCYDYVMCALARRAGYKIKVVGVRCHHRGGGTSTKVNVERQAEYDYSHRWFYDNFKDVMPARIS